jgi:hypothetical protein
MWHAVDSDHVSERGVVGADYAVGSGDDGDNLNPVGDGCLVEAFAAKIGRRRPADGSGNRIEPRRVVDVDAFEGRPEADDASYTRLEFGEVGES